MSQGRGEIMTLLDRHGLRPRRRLGQHFLADPNTVRRIVEVADLSPGDLVVEIGAGTGALTKELVASGATVVAYEVDEALRPLLEEVVGGSAELRFADAATLDFSEELTDGPWFLVANLPYAVGTPVLLDAVAGVERVTRFVVMVQREVADRLVAEPGSRTYGLPSVVTQLFCRAERAFTVGRSVFVPPPNVDSAVVRLDRFAAPDDRRARAVELAAAAFGQRRKMLRTSLRAEVTAAAFTAAGIDPEARPEQLAPSDFLELADAA